VDYKELLEIEEQYGAHNYHPLPVVLETGEGVWVWDVQGKKYMDMLSAYSALNQGHRHPRIIAAAKKQLDRITLTSRAFHNDQLGPLCKQIAELCGMEMVLPMNSGAEAVETALKCVRRWAYFQKKVQQNKAEIIVCRDNFHGRTISIVSFSTDEDYKHGFGPFTPGFVAVPYGDYEALEKAITPNTAAFLVEPIQGEAGVVVPPAGYLQKARDLCTKNNVLFVADEIQTGLGRTGKWFACDHEGVKPDMYILGKALGGGIMPVSAVVSSKQILSVFEPGSHGSTFGGNPLAAAVAREALNVLKDEKLVERSEARGNLFRAEVGKLVGNGVVRLVRGRGLLNAVDIDPAAGKARKFTEKLMQNGLLAKETHDTVIRFAPPLTISEEEIMHAVAIISKVLVLD